MNPTIGVDPSVSSTQQPMTERLVRVERTDEDTIVSTYKLTPPAPPTIPQFFNGCVTSNIQFLLHDVLSIIDASIPNKEQNKAVKNLIRNGFDKAWLDMTREAYPDSNFQMGPGHAIEPYQDKYKEIMGATKQLEIKAQI